MSRDDIPDYQVRFDTPPVASAKRNLEDRKACYFCHTEVDVQEWLRYDVPSEINDFDQPFCNPACFLSAVREYRGEERFFVAQHYLANLDQWFEPMELTPNSSPSNESAKRHKTQ